MEIKIGQVYQKIKGDASSGGSMPTIVVGKSWIGTDTYILESVVGSVHRATEKEMESWTLVEDVKENPLFNVQPEKHVKGMISVETSIVSALDVDFGLQVSEDGRVWICVDGKAFLRFKPKRN